MSSARKAAAQRGRPACAAHHTILRDFHSLWVWLKRCVHWEDEGMFSAGDVPRHLAVLPLAADSSLQPGAQRHG